MSVHPKDDGRLPRRHHKKTLNISYSENLSVWNIEGFLSNSIETPSYSTTIPPSIIISCLSSISISFSISSYNVESAFSTSTTQ